MKNSQEANQPNNHPSPSDAFPQRNLSSTDVFHLLEDKEKPLGSRPFFSENGLSQDIIKVTDAEPDICLEVFYSLYTTLWPQLEKLNELKRLGKEESSSITSLLDAWTNFIGNSIFKGVLCSPEKLVGKKKLEDIKNNLSESEGENEVFKDLEGVVKSIFDLTHELANYSGIIVQRKEIMASLDLIQEVYVSYRKKVLELVKIILDKESMDKNPMSEYHALENLLEHKAVIMGDIFGHHWAYRIPRKKARKLLSWDESKGLVKNYSDEESTRRVAALPEKKEALEPLVFFKANARMPLQPEKEFMLYSLYRHLQIPVPETALLILTNVFAEDPDSYYAVQASEAVTGESALEACKNTDFEQEAYVLQVIGALLANPSDGSFKNFKYSLSYKTLVGIDNDLIFTPELSGEDDKTVNVKSILYLLPQMDLALPKAIKTFFTTLDPYLTILSWLKDLCQKNREYNLLFSKLAFQKTRYIYQNLLPQHEKPSLAICLQEKVLVDLDLHGDSFYPQILVSKNLLASLTEKFQIIEKALLNNGSANSRILFEEISPLLGKYYHKLRLKFSDPEEALDAVWGVKKNGVDYSEITSLLSPEELDGFSFNQNVLDENNLPETFFYEYKNKVISGETLPLDKFIQRHSQRKRNNLFNLSQAFEELQFLIQEGFTDSQSPRDIADFWYSISKMTEVDDHLRKEMKSVLTNLPNAELKWLLTLEKYFSREESDVPDDLRPSSLIITGAFLKKRTFRLTASEKEFLFDGQGNIKKKNSLTGRAKVTCFPEKNPEFYLKQNPEFPGYEFASTSFMRLLGVMNLPHQDLIIINSKYPVLLTQAVDGVPVFTVWQNLEAFSNLDPFHTGLLIISAILLNPEDGKEDNFILSQCGKYLIPVDNDHSFLPSTIRQEGSIWNAWTVNTTLQTKTLLFCLDEMKKPIPLEVKQHFLEIDFDKQLILWMKELIKVEDRYKNLVGEDQQKAFLEIGTVLRIPFYEHFIRNLYWKINKIKDLLRNASEQTPFSLLRAVEPFVARYYQDSLKPGEALKSRFEAATNKLYTSTENKLNGSRMSILQTEDIMKLINLSKRDLQNSSTYDKIELSNALEVLEQRIQEQSQNTKLEQDLLCELDDQSEENLWSALFGNPLLEEALKSFFLSPKEGLVLKGSKFIESSKLKVFFRLTSDQGAKIKFLSLPNSPLLDSITLRTLVEGCSNIEYLNVSGCVNLQEIVAAKGEWPLLVRIEAKGCLMLDKVDCASPIRVLRIGTFWKIEISLEECSLDVLDIYMKKRQFDFHFKKGQGFGIKSINKPAQNFEFAYNFQDALDFYFKGIKIKIGKDSILSGGDFQSLASFFEVRDDQKDPLIIKERTKFWKAFLFKGDWPQLRYSSFSFSGMDDEGLSELSSKKWPLLKTLDLSNTKVTPRSVIFFILQGNSPNLQEIVFAPFGFITQERVNNLLPGKRPFIEKIDFSDILEDFDFESLRSIHKCSWPQLKYLDLSNNQLLDKEVLLFSQGEWYMLEILNLSRNRVSTVGVIHLLLQANWPNLKEIIFALSDLIDEDQVKTLLPAKWPFLEKVDLSGKVLDSHILRSIQNWRWPQLKCLDISMNRILDEELAILSQGEWPMLEILNFNNTQISTKGVVSLLLQANWPSIKEIIFMSSDSIDKVQVHNLLPDRLSLVERLDFSNIKMTPKAVDNILHRFRCPKLKYLDLSGNEIPDESLTTPILKGCYSLTELHLKNTKLSTKGMRAIFNLSNWSNSGNVNASFNLISDEETALSSQREWPLLENLPLQDTNMTDIETIVNTSPLPRLRHLNLSGSLICDQGLLILSEGNLPFLETLDLTNTGTTQSEVKRFLLRINLPNLKKVFCKFCEGMEGDQIENLYPRNWFLLESLDLNGINMTSIEIEAIRNRERWPRLKYLDISNNKIFGEAVQMLLLEKWPLLGELHIANSNLTFESLEILVNQIKLPNLKKLNISYNEIYDQGLDILANGKWPRLEYIDLIGTHTTLERITSLKKNHPEWPNLRFLMFFSKNAFFFEDLISLN